jgi:predicted DsbA family dithiol-disulfide isomerase
MVKPRNYDVTIVEYLDYQCPHCRTSHRALMTLLARDKGVRVIFRDWPVFGEASVDAAIAALGSKYQGKYVAMHSALMETPVPLDEAKIKLAAKTAGVDWTRLQRDIETHSDDIFDLLSRHEHQASLLSLQGTPAFIIGDVQSFGGLTLKELEAGIAQARAKNPLPQPAEPQPGTATSREQGGTPSSDSVAGTNLEPEPSIATGPVQQGQSRIDPAWAKPAIVLVFVFGAFLGFVAWLWHRRSQPHRSSVK